MYARVERDRLGRELFEEALRSGGPRQIAAATRRQDLETYGTPLLYAASRALSTGDYETDFRNFRLLALASLVAGAWAIGRAAGVSVEVNLALLFFFAAAFEPVVRPTLAARDRLHLFERHRYRAAAEEPLAGAEHHRENE